MRERLGRCGRRRTDLRGRLGRRRCGLDRGRRRRRHKLCGGGSGRRRRRRVVARSRWRPRDRPIGRFDRVDAWQRRRFCARGGMIVLCESIGKRIGWQLRLGLLSYGSNVAFYVRVVSGSGRAAFARNPLVVIAFLRRAGYREPDFLLRRGGLVAQGRGRTAHGGRIDMILGLHSDAAVRPRQVRRAPPIHLVTTSARVRDQEWMGTHVVVQVGVLLGFIWVSGRGLLLGQAQLVQAEPGAPARRRPRVRAGKTASCAMGLGGHRRRRRALGVTVHEVGHRP